MPDSSHPTSTSATPSRPVSHEGGGGATLSRELADFLVELSISLHKHAIYPAAHPLLVGAVDSVYRRLSGLLLERGALSLGVARKQLVIEGVATDPSHPLLHELAERLHRHQLGAVKFVRGVERAELADALATLATDVSRMEQPLGLTTEQANGRWNCVRIFPLTYDRLELLEEEDQETVPDDKIKAGRAAQLWVGLARAALAAEPTDPTTALEPVAVARAIEQHTHEQAYDQVIVGYLLQIASELRATDGAEAVALQRRISKLLGELKPETLTRLLNMGGDTQQRRQFLLDATQGMTVDAVVELVKAAADAEKQTISHSLVRMLTKLAHHAQTNHARHAEADRSLRDAVGRLLKEWTLDDPNPEGYRAVLETIARSAPMPSVSEASNDCEPERVVEIGLEVGVIGAQISKAVDQMLDEGKLATLLDMLDAAPNKEAERRVWSHLVERDTLRQLLFADRVDYALVERLVKRKGVAAVAPLLDAVEASNDAKVRERLYAELASLGDAVGPEVVRRLGSAHPAMQRELLALVSRLAKLPEGLDAQQYLRHADAGVRREAVKLLLRQPEAREATMLAALADSDERAVYMGLQAALEKCPRTGVDLVRARLDRGDLAPAVRALAIRVAATVHTPETLRWLVSRVLTRSKWLRRPKLAAASPEMHAALAAIAAGWPNDPVAAPVLTLAAKMKELRAVVTTVQH
jgi:hypothetical protein